MAYNFKVLPSTILNLYGLEAYIFNNACSLYILFKENDDYEELPHNSNSQKGLKANDARGWL